MVDRTPWGLRRFKSPTVSDAAGGWRLFFPIWAWFARRYDISSDAFVIGWWAMSVAISVERLGSARTPEWKGHTHGYSIRLTWGAVGLWDVRRAEMTKVTPGHG